MKEEINEGMKTDEKELSEKNSSTTTDENTEDVADEVNELDQVKEELAVEKDKRLRLFAEFENFKKRTTKERLELYKTANESLLLDLLPVLDDFERAMEQIKSSEDENHSKGVELIQNKLINTLKSKGLEAIETNKGDDFDVDFHEAVTQIPASSDDLKGKIIDKIETGYTLNGKVIRFTKVVVGK